jgi:hypothetical protein
MSTNSPSTHGNPGRGKNGRFQDGNKCGKGNPLAGRAAKIRAVLLEKLSPEKAAEIADSLIEEAKKGNLAAVRELFDRTVGKPASSELTDRMERLEQMVEDLCRES